MSDDERNSGDGFIYGDDGHGNLLIRPDIMYVPGKIAEIIERLKRLEKMMEERR